MEVRFEEVSFDYASGTRALDRLDTVIATGSRVAVIGANGSGKTTLARHLVGLLRPTAGRVLVGGVDAATLSVAQLAARVGLVFQDPRTQIFERSVRAEVAFGPHQRDWSGQRRARAVDEALAETGLADAAGEHPGDLGASRRKLLTIASVLAMETPIVVLDEPTIGLDGRGVGVVERILAGVAGEGRTCLVISHDLRFVAESCERVLLLHAGRVALDGTPAEVFDERHWPILAAGGLAPPAASRLGASMGLGSTPTEAALLEAMRRVR